MSEQPRAASAGSRSGTAAKFYFDADVSTEILEGVPIAMIGYGSQGRAHALNLRDSGFDVVVGLRAGSPSVERAESEGMKTASVEDATARSKVMAMMIPDQHQAEVYRESIAPHLSTDATLVFAHGFNVLYGRIEAPEGVDVIMVGPKAPGPMVRTVFEGGGGVPTVVAVHQNASGRAMDTALAYAKGLGCTRAGAIETTFEEETETDLFGEQVVLAGAAGAIVRLGFEVLVEAGYQPEIAYLECLHELKLVVDLIQQHGISGMGRAISDTAEYGSLTRGPRAYGEPVRRAMKEALEDIRSGDFAKEWMSESANGAPRLKEERRRIAEHPIEVVGKELRDLMRAGLRAENRQPR